MTLASDEKQPALKSIIVCADDYAFSAAVSRGILALLKARRLNATTVMVHSPRWGAVVDGQDDALALKNHLQTEEAMAVKPQIGLHLDWTSAFARKAGHGESLYRTMFQTWMRRLSKSQVRREIEKQLDLFERPLGKAPDFVDGHQHVQQFPILRQALVEALYARYGSSQKKPYLRISKAPNGVSDDFKMRVIVAMGARQLQQMAEKSNILCANGLLGAYDFNGGAQRYRHSMQRWLMQSQENTIIMCHPALDDAKVGKIGCAVDALGEIDEIAVARRWEYSYLASEGFKEDLDNARAQLLTEKERLWG